MFIFSVYFTSSIWGSPILKLDAARYHGMFEIPQSAIILQKVTSSLRKVLQETSLPLHFKKVTGLSLHLSESHMLHLEV